MSDGEVVSVFADLRQLVGVSLESLSWLKEHFRLPCKVLAAMECCGEVMLAMGSRVEPFKDQIPVGIARELRAMGMQHVDCLEFLDDYFGEENRHWRFFHEMHLTIFSTVEHAACEEGEEAVRAVASYSPLAGDATESTTPSPSALSRHHPSIPDRFLPPHDPGRCHACWEIFDKLFKCGNCRLALYCSKDCQKGHWKTHKPDCASWSEQARFADCD